MLAKEIELKINKLKQMHKLALSDSNTQENVKDENILKIDNEQLDKLKQE